MSLAGIAAAARWYFRLAMPLGVGRLAIIAGLAGVSALAMWAYVSWNYVPRADYKAVRAELRQLSEVTKERGLAAEADAGQAAGDLMMINALKEKIDELEIDGGGRVVFSDADAEWLRGLQRE